MLSTSKIGGAGGAAAPDANFSAVTMLLHGDGTNGAQNNTFIDSSTNNFTITRNGNTTQGTFSPYGSNWSNYFNGSTDYLTTNATSALNIGSGDVTIEAWVYLSSYASNAYWVIDQSSNPRVSMAINSTGKLTSIGWFAVVYTSTSSVSLNTWTHVALVRQSGTWYGYINGASAGGSAADSTNYNSTTAPQIGDNSDGRNYFNGYISNLRVVKGTAVYTTAFTPSTTPLTAITNTSLLTCQSNRFIDNSSNAFTITANGTPSIQRFSPFSPSAAYSTSVIGGSGYFDGAGDTLDVASFTSIGSGSYTVEGWAYWNGTGNDLGIVCTRQTGSVGFSIFLYNSNIYFTEAANTAGPQVIESFSIANTWFHFAAVKNGTVMKLYINGVSTSSVTGTTLISTNLSIGREVANTANFYWPGYISNVRISNVARYTANFTPPTSPVTSDANTLFLTNFTNAGIYDNAMMNDLETVGSAQVSTTQVKFGTGSMSFNGSSSYLQGPVNPSYAFSTGDFTVEFWVYVTSYTTTATTVVRTAGTSGWACQFDGTNKMIFYANGVAQLTDSASPSTGTWTYFAVVRSGSTLTMYRNGTSVASTTYATAINPTGVLLVGCGGDSVNTAYGLNGYIDDLRITKGYARTITTPTAAFPNN